MFQQFVIYAQYLQGYVLLKIALYSITLFGLEQIRGQLIILGSGVRKKGRRWQRGLREVFFQLIEKQVQTLIDFEQFLWLLLSVIWCAMNKEYCYEIFIQLNNFVSCHIYLECLCYLVFFVLLPILLQVLRCIEEVALHIRKQSICIPVDYTEE